jgi:hypothetical protein
MTKFITDLEKEIANLSRRRELEIESARGILAGNFGATHMGHNLASAATNISQLTAKIEQTEMVLRSLRTYVEMEAK